MMRINLERSYCTTTIKIKRRFSWKGSSQIQTDYNTMMNKEPKQSLKNNEINDRPAKTHEQHSVISASTVILDILYIHLVQLINILTAVFSSRWEVSDNYFSVSRPLPEVGTQGSEGKMYRLLMFLLCDVFLEEKDLFLWCEPSLLYEEELSFLYFTIHFWQHKSSRATRGEDGKKKQRKNHF